MNQEHQEVAKAVGSYLRRLREEAGLSLAQVLELLSEESTDVSTSTLSRAEQGRTILRMDIAQLLVERLGGTFEELAEVIRGARARSSPEGAAELPEDPAAAQAAARRVVESGRYHAGMRMLEALAHRLAGGDFPGADPALLPSVRVDLGDVYRRLRMYQRSFRVLGEALNSPAISDEDRVRAVLLYIADCDMTGDHQRGSLYARHALELIESWKGTWLYAYAQAVIGSSHLVRDEYADAVPYYLEALKGFEELGKSVQATQTRITLGQCLVATGQKLRGRELLRRALEDARAGGWKVVELHALKVLGDAMAEDEDWHRARAAYHEVAAMARRLGLETELFLALHGLWQVAQRLGDERASQREAAAMRRLLPSVDPGLREAREFRRWKRAGRREA